MASLPTFSDHRDRTIWVQAQLRKLNASFASIARENSWSRTAVRNAMYMALDAQERAIADKLGVTQEQLFPERFDAQGNRLFAVKSNDSSPPHNVKHHEAA